jgi:uncharacterized protein (DUF1778 family)
MTAAKRQHASRASNQLPAKPDRSLSSRDSKTFLELLESHAEPNAALKAAAKRYRSRIR